MAVKAATDGSHNLHPGALPISRRETPLYDDAVRARKAVLHPLRGQVCRALRKGGLAGPSARGWGV